jgi:hypothetical protein
MPVGQSNQSGRRFVPMFERATSVKTDLDPACHRGRTLNSFFSHQVSSIVVADCRTNEAIDA